MFRSLFSGQSNPSFAIYEMENTPRSRSLRRLYSASNTLSGHHNAKASSEHQSSSHAAAAELHPALIPNYKKVGQSLADAAAQAEWAAKKWVWVPDEHLGYIAGWVVEESNETSTVSCVDDKVGKRRNATPASLIEVGNRVNRLAKWLRKT